MKKRIVQTIVTVSMAVLVIVSATYSQTNGGNDVKEICDEEVALKSTMGTLITETADDKKVIPDKYNTGVKGELTAYTGERVLGKLELRPDTDRVILDFVLRNEQFEGRVTLENIDFSNYSFLTYNVDKLDRNIKVIFNNCKFSSMGREGFNDKLQYEFNNCTLESFGGSNCTFNNCSFGKSYYDGVRAFVNVTLNNCYFSDMSRPLYEKELHTDGTQLYGSKEGDIKNIHFNNCRFEIPSIKYPGSQTGVNACIMLQLEFGNANGLSFEDCIVNGGGYSIFARSKYADYSMKDVTFKNIRIGTAKTIGGIYSQTDPNVIFSNLAETDSLYVGSVWKAGGKTHLSVTNDTNRDRKLVAITDQGTYTFEIPACVDGKYIDTVSSFEEFPFDLEKTISKDCKYVVCFDATVDGCWKQIRFVNWSGEGVYLDGIEEKCTSGLNDVVASGKCGDDITYQITNDGTLLLKGTGATPSYNSAVIAPWSEYLSQVKKIVVCEGITSLGAQIFRNCIAANQVLLPNTLTSIGNRALSNCYCLTSISIPESVTTIDSTALSGTPIRQYVCDATQAQRLQLDSNYVVEPNVGVPTDDSNVVLKGKCGNNVVFSLDDNGVLTISGTGECLNYHSFMRAPWYSRRADIKKVVIGDGVTKIGEQMFCKCTNITCVVIGKNVEVIGKNSFIGCGKLMKITLPASLKEIGQYAFSSTGIKDVEYCGSGSMWDKVIIGSYNDHIKKLVRTID